MTADKFRRAPSRWWYRLPGSFYANGPTVGFYTCEKEARAAVREALGVQRLPVGAEFWKA